MRITKRQLRRIIRESLPYRKGQPWADPKAPVGDPVTRAEDHLDRELTDEEIEAAEGWEPADPAGDDDFWAGYGDATDGKGLPVGASPDYKAGWEDGNLNRVTEGITRRQLRRIIKEAVLRESNSTDPRGLKALLASLNVKGQEFKALAAVLSTTYHDFEGGPEDMKDEVEVNSGGLSTSTDGEWIDWPIETYQEIWDLYKKAEQSYKPSQASGPRF